LSLCNQFILPTNYFVTNNTAPLQARKRVFDLKLANKNPVFCKLYLSECQLETGLTNTHKSSFGRLAREDNRNGNGSPATWDMDQLTYTYNSGTNQLNYIQDAILTNNYTTDIKNQSANNYQYDKIGNLTYDQEGGANAIVWTVYGKIKSVSKSNGTTINYTYDAAGNRISKVILNSDGTTAKETWYVRDAQGNVLGIYEKQGSADLMQTEVDIYGSSRLGVYNRSINVQTPVPSVPPTEFYTTFDRGNKFFELTNHLGNGLVTVTDKRIPAGGGVGSTITGWQADVATANDYYPFGMQMPGRNGKAVQGGWASGTTVINGVSVPTDLYVTDRTGNTPTVYEAANSVNFAPGFNTGGNDQFDVIIATAQNTGPGSTGTGAANGPGDGVDGTSAYRYGFNGQEHSEELDGDDYTATFWEYDARTGRRWNVDPKIEDAPGFSPYSCLADNPIIHNDPDGDFWHIIAGAAIGAVVGAGIEAATQLYQHHEITSWKAVGGAAVQGGITGGIAAATGGASLAISTTAKVGLTVASEVVANVAGGAANRAIQGKKTTKSDVAIDAVAGAGSAVLGAIAGKATKGAIDKLSKTAKGNLGESLTKIKYASKGYISKGNAFVEATSQTRLNGSPRVAQYDHLMENIFTGNQLSVESKFNTSGLNSLQRNARSNVQTAGGLFVDRTNSTQVGAVANAATQGAVTPTTTSTKSKIN
jgi:YD repeat-containing protein